MSTSNIVLEIGYVERFMAVDLGPIFTIDPGYYGPGREASWFLDDNRDVAAAWATLDSGVMPRS